MSCYGHRWLPPFSGLMVCANCGESRSSPRNMYFDKDGFVRADSDEIHERRLRDEQRQEKRRTEERHEQLRQDLAALKAEDTRP